MEFLLVLFICPIIVLVASIIGFFLVRRWFVVPLLTFVVFTILTFTVFNESFFIWVAIYTILSVIVSLIMKFIKK
jgi:Na+/H+ antiporter NhaC